MFYKHIIRTPALLSSNFGDFISRNLDRITLLIARSFRSSDPAVWVVRVRWFLSVRPPVRAAWAEVLQRLTVGSARHES